MKMLLILLSVLLPCLVFGQNDTCPYIQYGEDHTMCQYEPGACPQGLLGSNTTQADIDAILETHNTLRNKVATGSEPGQPAAANMLEMIWDSELAMIAERWAEQCDFGHDTNRRSNKFEYVGQNVASTGNSAPGGTADFPYAINMWYDEVTDFDPANISPYDGSAGHYTQVIWAETYSVGCGYAYYYEDPWYTKYYVCNYGPGGNVIGGAVYEEGDPASNCPQGISATYPGLCSSENMMPAPRSNELFGNFRVV